MTGADSQGNIPAIGERSSTKQGPTFSIEVHGVSERGKSYELEGGEGEKSGLQQGTTGNVSNKKGHQDGSSSEDMELIGLAGKISIGTGRILRRWRDWIRVGLVDDHANSPLLGRY